MKTYTKTKLLGGTHLELRSYELKDKTIRVIHCKSEDYKNCKHEGEEYMDLTPSEQQKGKVVNTQQSKFYPYNYYRMIKYKWKPKGVIEENIEINPEVRNKLSEMWKNINKNK